MQFGRIRALFSVVLILTATTIVPARAEQQPQPATGWLTDFAKAEAEAKRLGRPILMHVYADWCGPCRRMEREVLHTSDLVSQLGVAVIGVKINSDHHPDLMRRFGVHALPSDVFISPDGKVLARTEGYQELRSYLGRIAQVGGQFAPATKDSTQIADSRPQETKPAAPAGDARPETDNPSNPVPPAIAQADQDDRPPATPDEEPAIAAAPKPEPKVLGLGGYSPVSLSKWRKWRTGRPQFTHEHQGVVYHLATAEELAEFRANPNRYAPQLLGCDPVRLWETDRAIPGSTRYGAYFEHELYLFASQESRERFKRNPLRYTRTRHVLHVDQIERTELR